MAQDFEKLRMTWNLAEGTMDVAVSPSEYATLKVEAGKHGKSVHQFLQDIVNEACGRGKHTGADPA